MKKLIFGFIALLSFNAATIAQAVKQVPAKTTESKMKAVTPTAKVVPIVKTTTIAPKAVAVNRKTVVLKKDGTPDKRYNNATVTVPLKKDGTPDKRFKSTKKN